MDLSDITLVDIIFGIVITVIFVLCSIKQFLSQSSVTSVVDSLRFHERIRKFGVRVVIVYGSQTGTAEEFAILLHEFLSEHSILSIVVDVETLTAADLSEVAGLPDVTVLFLLATYGNGEPTDSAIEFVSSLRDECHKFNGLRYSIFGLGNSTYPQFNACAVIVDRLLHQCGAHRLFACTLGDELNNMESTFQNWEASILACVNEGHPGNTFRHGMFRMFTVPSFQRHDLYIGEPRAIRSYAKQIPPFNSHNPFLARVLVNRELCMSGHRSRRHIELDLCGSAIRYLPGDHVAILPQNPNELVERISKRLNIDLDTVVDFDALHPLASPHKPFPTPCSYRTALTHYVDLNGPPRMHLLAALVQYTPDPLEKDRLQLSGSNTPEGKDLYNRWILDGRRNIVDVLEEFPSVNISAFELVPRLNRLKRRLYSISSSQRCHPDRLHITVAVVDECVATGKRFKGLASTWLDSLLPSAPDCFVPIFVQRSRFHLPRSANIPIILIATGTGLAPFRAFWQERSISQDGTKNPIIFLFYGCRHHSEDYLYSEELDVAQKSHLLELHIAFSRDPIRGPKDYVQNHLYDCSHKVWHLIDNLHAHVYVCGSATTMARDVHCCLETIIAQEGSWTREHAQLYLERMKNEERYHLDVWG